MLGRNFVDDEHCFLLESHVVNNGWWNFKLKHMPISRQQRQPKLLPQLLNPLNKLPKRKEWVFSFIFSNKLKWFRKSMTYFSSLVPCLYYFAIILLSHQVKRMTDLTDTLIVFIFLLIHVSFGHFNIFSFLVWVKWINNVTKVYNRFKSDVLPWYS